MKKIFLLLFVLILAFSLSSCKEGGENETDPPKTDAPTAGANTTEAPKEYDVPEEDMLQIWTANEIVFESDKVYDAPVYTVDMDVIFKNTETGKEMTVPAFWNGDKEWVVRFALTEKGKWSYETKCSDEENKGLNGKTGILYCGEYKGELDIYRHGFVTVKEGMRTFVYADGTPFFYLGDTHWTLPTEEIDGIGNISKEKADEYGITSQFKYIIDHRAEQGYTVIQSQPLSWYVGKTGNSWFGDADGSIYTYGVNDAMLEKFKQLDRYFAYIAEKGFLHANSQLSYPEELIESYLANEIDDEKIEKLSRYWVARYSAYPVLWTTTQEGDNDFYGWGGCTVDNNPWLKVMEYVSMYDPYDHPSSCHQENTGGTRVDNSLFGDSQDHDWYAAQNNVALAHGRLPDFKVMREYWRNEGAKPVVNYEARYDHYWTGSKGTRIQAWTSYLNGMFGYGYGVQPIWSIVWADYGEKTPTHDDVETYERDLDWVEGLYSEAGQQMIYLKDFITRFDWWKLEPFFVQNKYFKSIQQNYSAASIENEYILRIFTEISIPI